MNDNKDQPEPTMEEILASIRRIISEDGQEDGKSEEKGQEAPAAEATREASADVPESSSVEGADDVLDLTEVAHEAQAEPEDLDIPEKAPVDPPFAAAEPEPEPVPESEPQPEPPAAPRGQGVDDEAIVSPGPAAASTAAFASLIGALDRPQGIASDMPIGNSGLTLEELVRQMVRPMLREWLDANLPGMVERLVKREIERMVRRAED